MKMLNIQAVLQKKQLSLKKTKAIILQDVEMTQLTCTGSLLRAKCVHSAASTSVHLIPVTAPWDRCYDGSHFRDEKPKKVQNMVAGGGVRNYKICQAWLTGTYCDSLEWRTSLEHPHRIFPSVRPRDQSAKPVHK